MDLVVSTDQGLYCPQGDFYIDPAQGVTRAVVTHAHADHARHGSAHYLCHELCAPLLRARLGDVSVSALRYGEPVFIDGVRVSLHPAGHILGSAQVRIEHKGCVFVASGDYKLEADGLSDAFEPLRCDVFITESTFGLPLYHWRPQADIFADINAWWRHNADCGRASVMFAYALGKAQRLLKHLDLSVGPVICHGAIEGVNALYRRLGITLPQTRALAESHDREALKRALVLAPPSALGGTWLRRFGDYSDAFASGWMQIRGNRRRRGVDRGFVLSDHADWPDLLAAVAATGAKRIRVTHGAVAPFTRYLRESGFEAEAIKTDYGPEEEETAPGASGAS